MTGAINITAALLTVGFGLLGLLMPRRAARFVGLRAVLPAGQSEFRATFGGLFVALGAVPLLSGEPIAYAVTGAAWIATGLGRVVSIMLDGVATPKNWSGVGMEAAMGAACLVGAPGLALAGNLP